MNILFNELSINHDIDSHYTLHEEIKELMLVRKHLLNNDSMIYCQRQFINFNFNNGRSVLSYIYQFNREEKIDIMNWLSKNGPFWDDQQLHSSQDEYFHNEIKVTGFALAEAAAQILCNSEYQLFSINSSGYNTPKVPVTLVTDSDNITIEIENHNSSKSIKLAEIKITSQIESWKDLEDKAREEFKEITFTPESFFPLSKLPFYKAAAISILAKLKVLNDVKNSFEETGGFSKVGNELYQNYFIGNKAWFTDSSDGEKREFSHEMTFLTNETKMSCTWHGKIKTPQIRIHFSYPITQKDPLFIVYIGEKITKQ
ncbi:hypothetical protein OZ680_003312 [Yersinia enterocolitica]